MEFELEAPLNSLEECQCDNISGLLECESDHMPSRNFLQCLEACELHASLRQQAISLILQAQICYNYDQFVSYLAINYMDRFLSREELPKGKPWVPILLAVSCLSLASKMKNIHFSTSNFQRNQDLQGFGEVFDKRTINRMELLILHALNWRMRSITPFSFFPFFISLFQFNKDPSLERSLKDRATEIVFKSQNEIKLLEFKPSATAASALLLACHEQFPIRFPSFKCSVFSLKHVKKEKLEMCFNVMQQLVERESCEYVLETTTNGTKRKPLANSKLERKFCLSKSESDSISTPSITTANEIGLPERRKIKRPKLNGYCQ